MSVVDSVWYGAGPGPRMLRAVLSPPTWLYRAAMSVRNRHYDRGRSAVHPSALPVLSLGNMTVGGTGKTPVAAWAAARLRAMGGSPAIIMRGYGDDEYVVHARLNPDIPIVVDADRLRGTERARELGADCAVLDDGFQHRRIARVSDWVLVSAEQWRENHRVLPAGPLREPLVGLKRADVLLVTRKSASAADALRVMDRLGALAPGVGVACCHLVPHALVDAATSVRRPLSDLATLRVCAIAGIGGPDAFFSQLRGSGATVLERAFRDHHRFSSDDVMKLMAERGDVDVYVCTLKDAVKLAPLWTPALAPLWYVSQIAVIEQGHALVDRALESVLAARRPG